jgi:hypothetical protein
MVRNTDCFVLLSGVTTVVSENPKNTLISEAYSASGIPSLSIAVAFTPQAGLLRTRLEANLDALGETVLLWSAVRYQGYVLRIISLKLKAREAALCGLEDVPSEVILAYSVVWP